jgi:hypothetical protein
VAKQIFHRAKLDLLGLFEEPLHSLKGLVKVGDANVLGLDYFLKYRNAPFQMPQLQAGPPEMSLQSSFDQEIDFKRGYP